MLPTEDLFVYVYVLVDDAIADGEVTIPVRPGPVPACSDAELLTIALVQHLLGRRSEAGFLHEVGRDWAQLFPQLPHQSEANRRIRWLWAAFEQLRTALEDIEVREIDSTLADIDRARRDLDVMSRELTQLRRLKLSLSDGVSAAH